MRQNYTRPGHWQEEERGSLREKMSNHTVTDEELMTFFLHDICHTEPLPEDVAFFRKIYTAIGEDDQ